MTDPARPASPEQLVRHERVIDAWLAEQVAENPTVASVDKDTADGERRWIVRVSGEEKAAFSVWFHLRQRTLAVESSVMPAPEENAGQLYEHLLRRNLSLRGVRFAIGAEDGIFLVGETPVEHIAPAVLDQVLGSVYTSVEQCFRPAMRLGFASRFTG